MDKKSIIGLVLIVLIFAGYIWWTAPSAEEQRELRLRDSITRDSIMKVQHYNDSIAALVKTQDSLAAIAADSLAQNSNGMTSQNAKSNLGVFAVNASNPQTTVTVTNNLFSVDVSSLGAMVQRVVLNGDDYLTFDGRPLEIITPAEDNFDMTFADTLGKVINTRKLPFALFCNGQKVDGDSAISLQVPEGDSLTLGLRAFVSLSDTDNVDPQRYLEFRYVFYHDSYEVDFDVLFQNINGYVDKASSVSVDWKNRMNHQEQVDKTKKGGRSRYSERMYTSLYFKNIGDNADNITDGRDDEKQITSPIEWVAYKQQFFCAILMSEKGFNNAQMLKVYTDPQQQDEHYMCDMSSTLNAAYDGNSKNFAIDMRFYFGPTKYRILRDMDRGFERILPLGWGFFLTQWFSRFVIIPVFNFLESFGWNYGIIIIVLTILLKLVLSPLTYNSYKSGAVMRHLKPEIEALNKKFPKQEQAMQKQQAMQALNKKAGISPLAGCLPALIQFPILIAMYRFYPASIELRQQGFLWCDDLSSYDSILNLPFNIPLYGDHVSLFCLLMFGMQLFYTVYTMKQQQSQASMPGMKFMMYFMPFMMLFIFNSTSAALNIYYFFNLLLSMLQMFAIRAFITEDKVRARMAMAEAKGKGKPQKKSKFQQRLEEMQKMSEEMQRQRNKK